MSPFGRVQAMRELSPLSTFVPWCQAIAAAQPKLAYVHAVEPRANGASDMDKSIFDENDDLAPLRAVLRPKGIAFIVAGAHSAASALAATKDHDDLVAFGRFYICELASAAADSSQPRPADTYPEWLALHSIRQAHFLHPRRKRLHRVGVYMTHTDCSYPEYTGEQSRL